jgi:hypothetical protein
MQLEPKRVSDSHDDVSERQVATIAVDMHFDDVAIAAAEPRGLGRAQVNVTPRADDAAFDRRPAARSF